MNQVHSAQDGINPLRSKFQIVEITNMKGDIMSPEWLSKSEKVHRQLRPALPSDYVAKMRRVFLGGGGMSIAVNGNDVVGVAVYRTYENTFDGLHMYVDDLVTDETKRSSGVGKALIDHLQSLANDYKCDVFTLDSGTHRQQAHKFYFREGMVVSAFHFIKNLNNRMKDKQ